MRACDLELMLVHLEKVLEYAKANGFDEHFIAEANDLVTTVKHNQEK